MPPPHGSGPGASRASDKAPAAAAVPWVAAQPPISGDEGGALESITMILQTDKSRECGSVNMGTLARAAGHLVIGMAVSK
jgi:hypothetical protein